MSAASEYDAQNHLPSVIDAYPRDFIIQYVYKPTLVDHPLLTVIIAILAGVYPLLCEWKTQMAICDPVSRSISRVVVMFLCTTMIYVHHKEFSLRRAVREGRLDL